MRKLVVKMSMTLDGYVAGDGGEMDWARRTAHPDGKAWVGETLGRPVPMFSAAASTPSSSAGGPPPPTPSPPR